MEKTAAMRLSLSFTSRDRSVFSLSFIRMLLPLAAAERQERSD